MIKKATIALILITTACTKEKENKTITSKEDIVISKSSETEDYINIDSQLKDFIKAFNTNEYKKIDAFIDQKIGCLISYKDGYYPILTFKNSIEEEIDWFTDKVHTNIISDEKPSYLGDLEFKKNGFFNQEYKNKFSFDHFDNGYVNLPESIFKQNEGIKKACNLIGYGITKDNSRIYTFYFSAKANSLKLVAISYEYVSDANYANPSKKAIAFNSTEEVRNFLETKKLFEDKNNNAYVDFSKKEITYIDFGDNPIQFSSYKINKIESINSKIKLRTIDFIFSEDESQNFTLTLTNKGVLYKNPMGARPPYEYE